MSVTHLIKCSSCGMANRVTNEKLQHKHVPICGKCGAALPTALHPMTVTDADFTQQIIDSPLPALVDLWAPWCGPCRMLAPVIDQLTKELEGRVRVAKLNTDENPHTARLLNVQSIPTLVIFKDGREVDRMLGVQPKSEILRRLQKTLNS